MGNLKLKTLRLVGAVLLSTMTILVLTNMMFYKTLMNKVQTNAKKDVTDAVKVIDGDKLAKVLKNGSMDSAEYKEIQQAMDKWRDNKDIKYFYTMAKGEGDSAYVLVDSSVDGASELGEEYYLEDEMRKAFQEGKISYTNPVKDKWGIFISAYAPVRDSSGKIVAITGVDSDIKIFMYAEYKFIIDIIIIVIMIIIILLILKRTEETAENHEILFENAHDIILYIRNDGAIVDANKKAVSEYGYSYEELLTKKLKDLRNVDTLKELEGHMEAASKGGSVYETVNRRKDGSSFPVEVSSKIITVRNKKLMMNIIRDITERKKAEEKIVQLANHDSLTGVINRTSLKKQFELALEQAEREGGKFAVILFDIDNFKGINDNYGHGAGDDVLCSVAKRVTEAMRQTDVFGRLGGDEFLIIQPFINNEKDVAVLMDRIFENLHKAPVQWNNVSFDVNVSAGISIYPCDACDRMGLTHCADNAMYHTKRKGGNSYNFYSDSKECLHK